MALWLLDKKGWKVAKDNSPDAATANLIEVSDHFFPPKDDLRFRMNPDLIECVKTLQEQHRDEPFSQKWNDDLFDLAIRKVSVSLELENYHDGKEMVRADYRVD